MKIKKKNIENIKQRNHLLIDVHILSISKGLS